MAGDFTYADALRRSESKRRLLEKGEVEQRRLESPRKKGVNTPLKEHRPPRPPARPRGAAVAPSTGVRAPSPTRTAGARPASPGASLRYGPSRAARPTSLRKAPPPSTPVQLPAPPLEANEERLLLESAAMDLFGTGKRQPPQVCPDCHHEIVKVVCLGTAVGVCVECKGTWLPYAVVQELGRQSEWFRELGRAFQLAREAEEKSRNAP